ncbi:MAG: Rid family hydrolase [Rhodobacteraceae bacterium]|nr:Rid family hydrolase [Paracoccaceae bacterium]
MTRRHISTGSPFEAQIGYSRAVVVDGWVFALNTIAGALHQAGASLDDVVRVRYILPDAADWEPCWPIVSAAFARARPAATMISAGLQTPEMKIEIEVTARQSERARAFRHAP